MVKQLSVFMENKVGRLSEVTGIIAEKNINIRAMAIADTTNFGILRLIVDNPEEAKKTLTDSGLTVKVTQVVAVEIQDKPGALTEMLQILSREQIGIEYLYASLNPRNSSGAVILLKAEDSGKAEDAFAKRGIRVMEEEMVYKI